MSYSKSSNRENGDGARALLEVRRSSSRGERLCVGLFRRSTDEDCGGKEVYM